MSRDPDDFPGRGDVNPYGIPVPNPHELEGPDEERCNCGPLFHEPGCPHRYEEGTEEPELEDLPF